MAQFDELKEIFLADVAAEVLINDIPEDLIINWDQTGLRQLTAVLANVFSDV